MRELCAAGVEAAVALGASYADVRAVADRTQHVATRNGTLAQLDDTEVAGVAVRVLVQGAWGFAASSDATLNGVRVAAERAVEVAYASSLVQRVPMTWVPGTPATGTWRTPVTSDPFEVSLREKMTLLQDVDAALQVDPLIRLRSASTACRRQHVWLVTSEGTDIEQEFTWTGGGMRAVATNGDDAQVRSYPNSFGGQHAGGGWEVVNGLNLLTEAGRIGWEAAQLLSADPCPRMNTTIILDSSQLALQIHESIGHAAELDRVFGHEAAFAGGTYLSADRLGTFTVGSEHVNISADATLAGALGSFGWDDEGTPAMRWMLVERGLFVGYLDSRETASRLSDTLGRPIAPHGATRASGFHRLPLVRMVNVSLEPGDGGTLEELIANTEYGIYMETNSSWSIDDRRYNFQFSCERAVEIQNGMRVRLLRNGSYAGISPQFWQSCDAVCGPSEFKLWGLTNCGKGQPGQLMAMSHGAAPARFRNIEVGVTARRS